MSIDSGVTHRIIGTEAEIADESGLMLKPDSVYEDLSGFDFLYVSGGLGTVALYLVEKYWGADARVRIAAQMEYRGYSEE